MTELQVRINYLESVSKLLGVQNVSELRDSISTCRVIITIHKQFTTKRQTIQNKKSNIPVLLIHLSLFQLTYLYLCFLFFYKSQSWQINTAMNAQFNELIGQTGTVEYYTSPFVSSYVFQIRYQVAGEPAVNTWRHVHYPPFHSGGFRGFDHLFHQ